jgi:DNA modification methylase
MTVYPGDATKLPLADESVHCIVTSPPYNCGTEYEGYDDNMSWGEYIQMVHAAAHEMERVLVPGGRAWINVAPTVPFNGKPPDGYDIQEGGRVSLALGWGKVLTDMGLTYRDTVIWLQGGHDGGTSWGSWKSPSAPNLRGGYEVVLLYFKGSWKRAHQGPRQPYQGEDWQDLVRNVWTIPPVRRKMGAPYPRELPRRCIVLSTWLGEVVLDPFGGTGTTVAAAEEAGRVGIGFDIGARV